MKKLLPDGSVNNSDRFGSTLAISDDFMVVSAENSDTLGIYFGGAAYVYEKTAAGWSYRAMLIPSDPKEFDFFGNKVTIDKSGSTIVITNRNYSNGGIYIYERPVSGWATTTETIKITLSHYIEFDASIDISDDGSRIALISSATNPKYYLLNKPATGWQSNVITEGFAGPGTNPSSGIHAVGILLHQNYMYVSTDNEGTGIYVYKNNGTDFIHLAKLTTGIPVGQIGYFGRFLTAHNDLICATGAVFEAGNEGIKLFTYKKEGEWKDATETAQAIIPGSETHNRLDFPIQLLSNTEIAASVLVKDGDYYSGKFLHVTTNSDWQTLNSSIVYEKGGLSMQSEFANILGWNGSDLVGAAGSNISNRYAAISLTRSGNVWGSVQHVTLNRKNSSYANFGSSVVKADDYLFAGSPYDGSSGKNAGAVFIYQKTGNEFIRTNTIYPSRRKISPSGGYDAGFGHSIAVHGDELAVGATSYKYSEYLSGKIFIYKRTSSSWTSANLYDSIIAPPELMLNHVGSALAMNDKVLFVSAYNNFNNEHTNTVLVYEKLNDRWTFFQSFNLGKPVDKEWPSIRFSIHENKVLISSFAAIDGGVYLFSKNLTTGFWEQVVHLESQIFSNFGGDIKLLENHFFVGAPGVDFKGVSKSGAVYVYTKLPGAEWDQTTTHSAIIGPSEPIEGGYFGSSVDVIGNTLVAGAPGKFLTQDFGVRTIPGHTYVIQALDYYWEHTNQFLNLQGERYFQNERDHFGADVGIDEEYFYVGAQNESTSAGAFSGAVYYIQSPPIIYLSPPVCIDAGIVQLQGYPFGGLWSGSGVDSATGKFNPALAGAGTITLNYTTPNCSNVGTIQIEVKSPITVAQISPAEITICSQESIELQLESLNGAYNWFYRPLGHNNFIFLTAGGPRLMVKNLGEYFATVIGLPCTAVSETFKVNTEDELPLSVGPQTIICTPGSTVQLIASHEGGIWSGQNVNAGNFNSGNLPNGYYKVNYTYTTNLGCSINLEDSIKLNIIDPIEIIRIPTDFCFTGSALLKTNYSNSTLTYSWYHSPDSPFSLQSIQKPLAFEAEVFERGYYNVIAKNSDGCLATSPVIEIGFNAELPFELNPEEDTQTLICDLDKVYASIVAREGTEFTWQFKINEQDNFEVLPTTGNTLILENSGSYKVLGTFGFCSFESQSFNVQIKKDSLFVPNVFTPNNDHHNDVFQIESNLKINHLNIFNRYGQEVHSSQSGPWNGGNYSAGTYFWIVTYESCDSRVNQAKGWVSLMR